MLAWREAEVQTFLHKTSLSICVVGKLAAFPSRQPTNCVTSKCIVRVYRKYELYIYTHTYTHKQK